MTIINGRSFPEDCLGRGGSEALCGRAMPQIGKMRFGSCAGEVAYPRALTRLYCPGWFRAGTIEWVSNLWQLYCPGWPHFYPGWILTKLYCSHLYNIEYGHDIFISNWDLKTYLINFKNDLDITWKFKIPPQSQNSTH